MTRYTEAFGPNVTNILVQGTRVIRVMARPAMKSDRDKIAAKARRMASDPLVAAEWRAAWNRVLAQLQTLYAARRPAMKSFEAHHGNEVAREAMLRALVDGKTIEESEALALATTGRTR